MSTDPKAFTGLATRLESVEEVCRRMEELSAITDEEWEKIDADDAFFDQVLERMRADPLLYAKLSIAGWLPDTA